MQSVDEIMETLSSTAWSFELIFVEDCSKDGTREAITEVIKKYPEHSIQVILHETNTGRGRTVTDGMYAASGEVAGFIDIDLEVHCLYIPACVLAIRRGADVAVAKREYKLKPRLFHRHIISRSYIFLIQSWLGTKLRDTESGFKFFRLESIQSQLKLTADPGWFWDTEIMLRAEAAGLKIVEIPALFIRRYDKKSTVRVVHDSLEYLLKLWRFRRKLYDIRRKATNAVELDYER